ncbi:NADH-quinone oxidoreductase subunit J [Gammaproteobacteria bacterium ESL0073]|uniref:NADH-quinone oxidoreductase subunit J n=1 Tax=Entomomonas moraniae TaxID=2213226 RepID=A0A3S9XC51_9GAMM|nr:NADH-quinone oxidoreductase subunit J [Entomomonas moraniae]AWM80010.1 NADH-quinone oxidoreductase subunit J [Gammaproteobacteria bacterium ESL0073]AZS49997.1 NADH-quinone oxidoreductase subunit J [Entomomonas moraniae]
MAAFCFYLSSAIAIIATLLVITNSRPVHALLYLIVSLLAISMCFFSLGAPFAGALEIIVYAGAIMVLFIFVVMMLNLGTQTVNQELQWLSPKTWVGPTLLSSVLLIEFLFVIFVGDTGLTIGNITVSPVEVGLSLFSTYLLAVELASLLLLAALVTAYHIGRQEAKD